MELSRHKFFSSIFVYLAVFVVSFSLFSLGISWGLPQYLDLDEKFFVDAAFNMFSPPYGDPGWYGAPASLLIDILAFFFGAFAYVGYLLGEYETPRVFSQRYWAGDITLVILIGRVVTATAAALAVIVFMKLIRKLTSNIWIALFGTTIFLMSPLLYSFSVTTRMDMFQVLFILLLFNELVGVSNSNFVNKKSEFFIGAFFALSVVSKYPSVVLAPCILFAFLFANLTLKERLQSLARIFLFSQLVAFLVAPYLYINFSGVLFDVLNEARSFHLSATSYGFLPSVWAYIGLIPDQLGWPVFLACCLCPFLVRSRTTVLFLLSVFCYLTFISSLSLWWERWLVPVLPLVIVVACIAISDLLDRLQSSYQKWFAGLMLCALSGSLYATGLDNINRYRGNQFVEVAALNWLHNNIPKGSRILAEKYTPHVLASDYDVYTINDCQLEHLDSEPRVIRVIHHGNLGQEFDEECQGQVSELFDRNSIDYLILGVWHERFRIDAERFNNLEHYVSVYDELVETGELVKSFSIGTKWAPQIRVYKVK